jgi:hypothetical protein
VANGLIAVSANFWREEWQWTRQLGVVVGELGNSGINSGTFSACLAETRDQRGRGLGIYTEV